MKLLLTTTSGVELSCTSEMLGWDFHPSALFIARKNGSKRDYDKEARPNVNMFQQELHIVNKQCYIVNKHSDLDRDRQIADKDHLFPIEQKNGKLEIGENMNQLNLIILKCHLDSRSKDKKESITLGDFIKRRISDESLHPSITKEFTGKKSSNKFTMRIRVQAFSLLTGDLVAEVVSENIVDSDKWAFKLDCVVPSGSCSNGGEKVVMVNQFPLGEGKVLPRFQLWNITERASKEMEDTLLKQPDEKTVKRVRDTIIFTTPAQPNLVNIEANELTIKLAAFKEKENMESNALDFTYVSHAKFVSVELDKVEDEGHEYPCSYCCRRNGKQMDDSIGASERAKPHQKRKVLSAEQISSIKRRSVSMTNNSPRSITSDSGVDLSPEPHHLDDDLRFTEDDYSGMRDLTSGIDPRDVLRENGIETDGCRAVRRRSPPNNSRQQKAGRLPSMSTCSFWATMVLIAAFILEILGFNVMNPNSLVIVAIFVILIFATHIWR